MLAASVSRRRLRETRRSRAAFAAALPLAALLAAACENVSVNPLLVAEVRVEPEEVTLAVGDSRQFQVRVFDAAGRELRDRPVTWGTDAPDVVLVTDAGAALALSPGTARITAVVGGTSGAAALRVTLDDGQARIR